MSPPSRPLVPMKTCKALKELCTASLTLALSLSLCFSPLWAHPLSSAPQASPSPSVLFAQMDDASLTNELSDEETLADLQNIEYDREALSMGKAVTMSLIPGGGFGLIYANKKAQGLLVISLTAVGYILGLAYASGSLDTSSSSFCVYKQGTAEEQRLDQKYCGFATDSTLITNPNGVSPPKIQQSHSIDPRSPSMEAYFQTAQNYTVSREGEDYSGQSTGLKILLGTYIVSSLVGAIWSGRAVFEHNDEVRKRVESTASVEPKWFPVVSSDGQQTNVGLGVAF